MRFYCFEHSKIFFRNPDPGRVRCDIDNKDLGRDFPAEDFWEQCNDCETVWLADTHEGYKPARICPVCGQELAVFYLCDHCGTIKLASPATVKTEIFITASDLSTPETADYSVKQVKCGACFQTPERALHDHYCLKIGRAFSTARLNCPFECGAGFFPVSVGDYLRTVNSKYQKPVWPDLFDIADIRFVDIPINEPPEDESSPFLLTHNGSGKASILLPLTTTFVEDKKQQALFKQCFDYREDSVGEIQIIKPALVQLADNGWVLTERGKLSTRQVAPPVVLEPLPQPAEQPFADDDAPPDDLNNKEQSGRQFSGSANEARQTTGPFSSISHYDADYESKPVISIPSRLSFSKGLIITVVVIGVLIILSGMIFLTRSRVPGGTREANYNGPTPSPSPTQTNAVAAPKDMTLVPGGEFLMGNDAGDEYERPSHRVTVQPFYIDIYEVTNEQYATFVKATGHRPPPTWINGIYPAGTAKHPVTGVNWYDATEYAQFVDKRLPTEEQWEFAARGKDGLRYPWGNEWKEGLANANVTGGLLKRMTDVGTYSGKSPFGAYDMVGNAWEWTASDLAAYPGGRLPPQNKRELKVIRGGFWGSNSDLTTTFRRGYPARGDDYRNTGFRCVREITSSGSMPSNTSHP